MGAPCNWVCVGISNQTCGTIKSASHRIAPSSYYTFDDSLEFSLIVGACLANLYDLDNGVYPKFEENHVVSSIETLYHAGEKQLADKICNAYTEAGYDSLSSLWKSHNNQ